jgi:hypothetical protein
MPATGRLWLENGMKCQCAIEEEEKEDRILESPCIVWVTVLEVCPFLSSCSPPDFSDQVRQLKVLVAGEN